MQTKGMGVRITVQRYSAPMAGVEKAYNILLDISTQAGGNRDMKLIVKGHGTDIQTIQAIYEDF